MFIACWTLTGKRDSFWRDSFNKGKAMAYGFRCALCGEQETPHENWSLVDHPEKLIPGFRMKLNTPHQFRYQTKDYECLVEEYLERPIEDLKGGLPILVQKKINKALPPRPINHTVLAIIGGIVVDIGL